MKRFTKLFMTLALLCVAGSASAQEETDITTLPWVQKGQECKQDFNNANGGTVYGTDAGGTNISYVDVSAYGTIKLYGTKGQTARLFINREEAGDNNGTFNVTIGEDGVATFDCNTVLTQQPKAQYIHLNGVKAKSWDTTLNLSSITVSGSAIEFPEPDPFVLPDGEVEINTLTWVNQGQGCANNLGIETDAPIYGTDAGPVDGKLSYIDATNYTAVKLYGPDGTVRLFINRAEYASGTFQFYVEIKDGVGTLNLANVYAQQSGATYIHINGVKASAPGAKAQVNHITLVEKDFEFPEGVTDITTLPYVNEGQGCVNNLGIKTGDPIYGTHDSASNGNLSYVDVTNYSAVKLYGTAGDEVRLFINRAEYPDAANYQFNVKIGEDGVGTLNLADVYTKQSDATYVHINGVKAIYGNTAKVNHIGVVEGTTVRVRVGATGYATFSSTVAVNFSGSTIKAYTAKVNGTDITFERIPNVPANTGVLLWAEGGAVDNVPIVEGGELATIQNNLVANATKKNGEALSGKYILAEGNNGIGFYPAGSSASLAAGKAYLEVLPAGARIILPGDEATGINAVEAAQTEAPLYNLQGQRVVKAAKGVNIKGGKKFIVR